MKWGIDWFSELKVKVMVFSSLLQMMRVIMIQLLIKNAWFLEKTELSAGFFKLCQRLEESTIDIDLVVENIEFIEEASILFEVEDLQDEIALIQDTVSLELEYMILLIGYIRLLASPMTSFSELEKLEIEFTEQGIDFFPRMEENKQMLKQIRQERRENYIE